MKTLRLIWTTWRLVGGPRPAARADADRGLGRRPDRIPRIGVPLAIVCAIAGAGPGPLPLARAADYYVDGSNPACSDAGPGTQAAPYCTIGAALAAHHAAGTTIDVMPGAYHEQVTVPASGSSGSPIVLRGLGAQGRPVLIDGADDFSDPARWVQSSGDVWLASSVTWSPLQVFADGARVAASSGPADSLPPRRFLYVAGTGLYVNAGGGNPGLHQTMVGHRPYGFYVSGRSWVTIDGFTVTRCEARGIQLTSASSQIEVLHDAVSFAQRYGIQAAGCSAVHIASCVVGDNGDHGIALTAGTTGCVIEDNESFRNVLPSQREANGLYLFGCPGNLIRRNRFHDNQDTGLQLQSGSNDNLSIENLSWNNGDHGYDHLMATGNVHIGDVAYGNYKDGFSIEGNASGQTLYDCIAVNNGLTTNEFDLWVDQGSSVGFVSNDNVFWNSTSQPPVKYITTLYSSVAAYSAASRQDTRTIQADPRFVDPGHGDFHLMAGSPAIDDANSGVPDWPATDADGRPRVDDPATPNRGLGPIHYADRGAFEYEPGGSGIPPPVARLSITPSAGDAPLAIMADASGSYDPGGTITSYRFDFGDGTAAGPQAGPTATHAYAAGSWDASVTVTDSAGGAGSATAHVDVASNDGGPNLVGNASFETDSAGWAPLGGAILRRVRGGLDGNYSLEVQGPSGTTPFGVTDQPNWVTSTAAAGALYRINAWVRSATGAGRATLRVRETSPKHKVWTSVSPALVLSPSWRLLTLDLVTHAAGSTLDLQIQDQPARSTESFQLDAVSIRLVSGAVPARVAAAAQETQDGPARADSTGSEAFTRGIVSPNPFRDAARLAFATSRPGPVSVRIYDVGGRTIRTLLDQVPVSAGLHTIPLNGRGDDGSVLTAGLYFYQIRSPDGLRVGRFVITK